MIDLTDSERKLLESYAAMPVGTKSHWNRLAVEIVPPVLFASATVLTGHRLYLYALLAVLVFFNVLRVAKQRSILASLKSLAIKILENRSDAVPRTREESSSKPS